MPADTIIHNAKIATNATPSFVEAVAITSGKISATGTSDKILRQEQGPATKVIDANGRTVMPGLNDSHLHTIRGGLNYNMELRWDGVPSLADALRMLKDYLSADKADAFIRSFLSFSHGKVVSNDDHAPGVEIGRQGGTYRRVRITSNFGKLTVLVTDGHLPYPYGREQTGVANLQATLAKAKGAGVTILVDPYQADQREAALVQFPGGYIAEIHSPVNK